MDRLLTIDLDEDVVGQIDRTAERLGKTRFEVVNIIVKCVLENYFAKNNQEESSNDNLFYYIKPKLKNL